MNKTPRMRTISAAIREIKESDPNSCFTEHALRKAILTKHIPTVMAGKKYLVDLIQWANRYISHVYLKRQ